MTTVTLEPDRQRGVLARFVALHEDAPIDPGPEGVKPYLARAVKECLARDELALGLAVVALASARGVGLHAQAASLLWELVANRERGEAR